MNIEQPGSQIDHMLRETRHHHIQLSSMADLKANILLTLSSVVMTISARYISDPRLKWSAMVLIFFCLLTIGLSIYTVMPKIPVARRSGPAPDVHNPNFNLLFFGDFINLEYNEFEKAMEEVLNDPSLTYQAQVREVYILGKFLAIKKYRFVRLAYLAFIVGLIVSIVMMLLAELTK